MFYLSLTAYVSLRHILIQNDWILLLAGHTHWFSIGISAVVIGNLKCSNIAKPNCTIFGYFTPIPTGIF